MRFDVGAGYEWNRHGNGIASALLDYAVTLLTSPSDAAAVRDGAAANAEAELKTYPQWFASFDIYFGPRDMDSVRCLRWRDYDGTLDPQCLPLGGQSVWSTAGAPPDGRAVVLATAALDSSALFHEVTRAPSHTEWLRAEAPRGHISKNTEINHVSCGLPRSAVASPIVERCHDACDILGLCAAAAEREAARDVL